MNQQLLRMAPSFDIIPFCPPTVQSIPFFIHFVRPKSAFCGHLDQHILHLILPHFNFINSSSRAEGRMKWANSILYFSLCYPHYLNIMSSPSPPSPFLSFHTHPVILSVPGGIRSQCQAFALLAPLPLCLAVLQGYLICPFWLMQKIGLLYLNDYDNELRVSCYGPTRSRISRSFPLWAVLATAFWPCSGTMAESSVRI